MKPRVSPAPLTQMDRWIWQRVSVRCPGDRSLSMAADGRDANLMHTYTHRSSHCKLCAETMGLTLEFLQDCRAYDNALKRGQVM